MPDVPARFLRLTGVGVPTAVGRDLPACTRARRARPTVNLQGVPLKVPCLGPLSCGITDRRSRGPSAKADPIPLRLKRRSLLGLFFVSILPMRIFGRPGVILRPDLPPWATAADADERLSTIEVATDIKLRETYGLQDGDEVEVTIL
jgi:hypothetical protein